MPMPITSHQKVLRPGEINFAAEAQDIRNSAQSGREPAAGRSEDLAVQSAYNRINTGRNERCPCGSGRKYKVCCMRPDEALIHATRQNRVRARTPEAALEVPPLDRPTLADELKPVPKKQDPVMEQRDALWDRFGALSKPESAQMDELLDGLLALPPELTEWYEVMHALGGHDDLPGVFRKIASAVPHTEDLGMGIFYWAAAEELLQHGFKILMPELVARFCTLEGDSFDATALKHIEELLLAEGCEEETLQLAEHYRARKEQGAALPAYDNAGQRQLIFELRAGKAVQSSAVPSMQETERTLREAVGTGKDVRAAYIQRCAAVICGTAPDPAWTRAAFDIAGGSPADSYLQLYATLLAVAREAAVQDGVRAGKAFRELSLLLESIYAERAQDNGKREKLAKTRPAKARSSTNRSNTNRSSTKQHTQVSPNVLDYLRAAQIEARIKEACRDLFSINIPKARLLLGAHATLLRFAQRYRLVPAKEAASTETELARLAGLLNGTTGRTAA